MTDELKDAAVQASVSRSGESRTLPAQSAPLSPRQAVLEMPRMDEIRLACGELNESETRLVKAVLGWFIRRANSQIAATLPDESERDRALEYIARLPESYPASAIIARAKDALKNATPAGAASREARSSETSAVDLTASGRNDLGGFSPAGVAPTEHIHAQDAQNWGHCVHCGKPIEPSAPN